MPLAAVSTFTFEAPPDVTENRLLVPVSDPPVRVAVIEKVPGFEIVTLCELNTPFVKAAVVPPPAESVPVEVISTVPENPVTVFPDVSRAVTLIANETPAACAGIFPPADDSTRKLSSAPGVTVSVPDVAAGTVAEVPRIAAVPILCPVNMALL